MHAGGIGYSKISVRPSICPANGGGQSNSNGGGELFGLGKRKPTDSGGEVNLDELIARFGQGLDQWQSLAHADVLARARFADLCRDVDVMPMSGQVFQKCWSSLNQPQQQRLCLQINAIPHPSVLTRLSTLCEEKRGPEVPFEMLRSTAVRLDLLTLDMLAESDVRLEEFARHFCAAWKLQIEGESDASSQARLHEIDFEHLMKEANAARGIAEERLEYLRTLQKNQEETRRPRRGKW